MNTKPFRSPAWFAGSRGGKSIVAALLTAVFTSPHVVTAPQPQAASPPRGWNSYDAFTWRVTEAEFLANCQYVG